ncbi:hypothetical protein [Limnohabitans sp. Rim8]|uniref:hypothetical protein n=1 Tax=Limnohabitans sp. Rim8 TaxID=1100718 RepID=UPI0033062784
MNLRPAHSDTGDTKTGEYSIITRDDGSLQWAASGKPLYFYSPDVKIGDQLSENVATVWHVAKKLSFPNQSKTGSGGEIPSQSCKCKCTCMCALRLDPKR